MSASVVTGQSACIDRIRLRGPPSSLERDPFSSDHQGMEPNPRRYRFTITVEVEPDHPAHDDPEWAADAAWGALTNEYGLRAVYSDIEEVAPSSQL